MMNISTGDLDGARNNTIKGGVDSCVYAVAQAPGECQQLSNMMTRTKGTCKIEDAGGGIWQVSNYNTDPVKDASPCNTLDSLTNPCCAARAAYIHAKTICTVSNYLNGTPIIECPNYIKGVTDIDKNVWDNLDTPNSDAHVACWNGPFCVDASDGDWLQKDPNRKLPTFRCESLITKEMCSGKEHSCFWSDETSQCYGGFSGWEDSWSKYAYGSCCDNKVGCSPGGKNWGCFNLDIKSDYGNLKSTALAPDRKGLGQYYLQIAMDACDYVSKNPPVIED